MKQFKVFAGIFAILSLLLATCGGGAAPVGGDAPATESAEGGGTMSSGGNGEAWS